ncbi:hypothetical protein J4234_02645 [Candidatus Woesearchaeota archaeon]|nr:hypothetical protein [Candidatus Woesearchaeota archaeon]
MQLNKRIDGILGVIGNKAFLVYVGIREWASPTEGEYLIVAPSGNVLYIGPSLRERLRKRLDGEYLQNPGVLSSKSAYGTFWTEDKVRYDRKSPYLKVDITEGR